MELIEAHRRGEPDAIGRLLRAYQRRVYSVCYRMVQHTEDAADLTQDALLKVLQAADRYDGRAAFSTWVIRIAMNCCLSHLRKQRTRRHQSLDLATGPTASAWSAELADPSEPSPGRGVEQAEERSVLLRCLGRLDAPMRAVLVLRDMQDLDYHQIGEVLDVPLGTVKSRLFRARTALRTAMEKEISPGSGMEGEGEI